MAAAQGAKLQGFIHNSWKVAVFLAEPTIPARKLAELWRNCSADSKSPVSHTRVCHIRDAFAALLVELRRDEVTAALSVVPLGPAGETAPVFVRHIHDEASMRLKSYNAVPVDVAEHFAGASAHVRRGRYAKVQNNAVHISVGHGPSYQNLAWFMDLQPLARKDGNTIATALILAMRGGGRCRLRGSASQTPWATQACQDPPSAHTGCH